MKKLLSVLTAAIISLVSFAAYCAENISVTLDGKNLDFDVPPQIIDDRTFVPMRAIFEALGADVNWDDSTKSVTADKDGTEIIMTIGHNMMFVNYAPVVLEAPPVITDGRTLVPVRAVAESFDCEVEWDQDTKTVIITSAKQEHKTEYTIEYDKSAEQNSHSAANFKLTNISKNSDGKYEISYTVETYQDDTGYLTVFFDCLDENGKVVDIFAGYFRNEAYNWTSQTGRAVISGNTVKIRLAE